MNARLNGSSPVKAKIVKTATARPSAAKEIPHAADVSEEALQSKWQQFVRAQDELLAELGVPSWKRKLMALLATMVVCVGIGWLVGQVLSAMLIGMLMLTGSAFLAWTLYAVGLIIGAIYGGKIAGRIGGAVLTGEADERATAAWSAVKTTAASFNPMRLFHRVEAA